VVAICYRHRLPAVRRCSVLVLAMMAVAWLSSSLDAAPTVEYALGLEPSQPNVAYDRLAPADAAKASITMEKNTGGAAWVVRAADGRVLRTFADTNNDRVVDRWSYFANGIEVYRDIDSDNNSKADQARWLGVAGTRWGIDDDEDGVLDRWKMISAEEVTAEVVAALASRDPRGFSRLLPTAQELQAAGFRGDRLDDLQARREAAAAGFAKLVAGQPVASDARWSNMLADLPGVLAADGESVAADVLAYDNVVALFEGAQGPGQVFVGSLLQCGDAWKIVDLPQLPGKSGEIREPLAFFSPQSPVSSDMPPQVSDALKPILESLRIVEERLLKAGPTERPELVVQQLKLLEQIVANSPESDFDFWVRQCAETIAAAVQESAIPDGIERLGQLGERVADNKELAAFVAFRLASSRYVAGMLAKDADLEAVQNAWLADLAEYVTNYPESPESAEAMLQIGISEEFASNEEAALEPYERIVAAFPESAASRKAAGAARRLTSVGKSLSLTGRTADGASFSLASLKGKPVLVHDWATWCEPCKVDIARIRELRQSLGPQQFSVVGISLDTDRESLEAYLGSNALPWVQLHEQEGLDGRLAEELGVLTLPTMLLLDADGKVVDRSVLITELERKLGELLERP
jgi:thiol-disulfide isomerase/thioredoxin